MKTLQLFIFQPFKPSIIIFFNYQKSINNFFVNEKNIVNGLKCKQQLKPINSKSLGQLAAE